VSSPEKSSARPRSAGWWPQAKISPSPHYDQRPAETVIDLLVIHYISLPPQQYGGGFIEDFFLGKLDPHQHPYFQEIKALRVSSHFLIDRLGAVTQFVSTQDRAWHAGVSHWQGRDRCNDFSIGIELEGDELTPFTEAQYASLAVLCQDLMRQYPLKAAVGHCHVAPGRKIDPGPYFDWGRFYKMVGLGTSP
jgi:AmpD protein